MEVISSNSRFDSLAQSLGNTLHVLKMLMCTVYVSVIGLEIWRSRYVSVCFTRKIDDKQESLHETIQLVDYILIHKKIYSFKVI